MSKARNIKTGEIVKTCPVTGDEYRVTRWEERTDGRVVALEKERLESEEYDE